MSEIVRTEHYMKDANLPELFLQSWVKKGSGQRGLFFITHGISEHSDCYHKLATAMAEKDWTVFSWDLQGHGRSSGKRGFVPDFAHFARDLGSVLQQIKSE